MREIQNIENTKSRVKSLMGEELRIIINRGRNKFMEVEGEIFATYPNVFTLRAKNADTEYMTFSYSDVMTNNVRFYPSEKKIMS